MANYLGLNYHKDLNSAITYLEKILWNDYKSGKSVYLSQKCQKQWKEIHWIKWVLATCLNYLCSVFILGML